MDVAPHPPVARLYLDRLIAPRRALSRRGLVIVLSLTAFWNLLIVGFLLVIHAWPVPFFLGLDFLGIWIALRVSNARARRGQRVRVSAQYVQVCAEQPGGASHTVWSSPTGFTRVEVQGRADNARVRLVVSGRGVTVGDGLPPSLRADFGREVERAILRARGERWG